MSIRPRKQKVEGAPGGTRTRNLRLRRATPCPLGHESVVSETRRTHELHGVPFPQRVAVHDGGHVAEQVLAAVGLRWGKNASSFCSRDRYVIRTRNLQDWNLTRYRCANRSKLHPVGFEPTPPKRLGLKSNALDQLGHGYKWAAWNSSDDGGVRTHARRLVPKTSA